MSVSIYIFRFVLLGFLFLSVGCAAKFAPPEPSCPIPVTVPTGMEIMPELLPEVAFSVAQQVAQAVPVSDTSLLTQTAQYVLAAAYRQRFFAPWHMTSSSVSAADAFWGVSGLGRKQGYAENLQPYPRQRWEQVVALQNMAAFPSMAIPAIVTRNTSLRVLPSMRPFFLDPNKAGEGFPFDYLQNSALWLGTPVLLAHVSMDRAWFFVETAFAVGWVRAEDVAVAGEVFRKQYEASALSVLIRDDVSLLSDLGHFVGQTHAGALFPLLTENNRELCVGVPVRDARGNAEVQTVILHEQTAVRLPLPLTSRNVARVADAMHGQLYGWGGMFENRDCSAAMRDIFAVFGLWLPRNSSQQAQQGGRLVALDTLSTEGKIAMIRDQGQPFLSLIWMQGHIGLYLGVDASGEPLMLHNMWGVRTTLPSGAEGRAIAGRLVISTLRPGEERVDVHKNAFLERVRGLTLLGQESR